MTDLTPERIAELRGLAAAATPGPWTFEHDWSGYIRVFAPRGTGGVQTDRIATFEKIHRGSGVDSVSGATANAAFIAAAREALPAALDRIEEIERLRASLNDECAACDRADARTEIAEEALAALNRESDILADMLKRSEADRDAAIAALAAVREGLEPFARAGESIPSSEFDNMVAGFGGIAVGHLRRARALLSAQGEGDGWRDMDSAPKDGSVSV